MTLLAQTVALAPMAGVTDAVFRNICRQFGAVLTYSEMVSAKALTYGDKKTKSLLYHEGEAPFGIQLFGHEPEILAKAAAMVRETGTDFIDLNMGCPAPKIVNNGDGSALLRTPALCGQLVQAVKQAVDCPVTVKIRLGWDADHSVETAKILEESGADVICVHGRTRVQQYSGHADWNAIERVVQAVSVPVIANGDVTCREDAEELRRKTGCAGVMIGRGAMGNPWIFRELSGGEAATAEERIDMALAHTAQLIAYKGAHIGILEARKHVCWYLKGIPGSGSRKGAINTAKSYQEMAEILQSLRKSEAH